MIVIIEGETAHSAEQFQQILVKAGASHVRALQISNANVLLLEDADYELVERVKEYWPWARVIRIETASPLADRRNFSADTIVRAGAIDIGGAPFTVMAGPCAVESEAQFRECAEVVKEGGAVVLRGGAFKPRTSPYSFQGMGREGVGLMAAVGREMDLPIVSEVVDPRDVEYMADCVDVLQIGARNAQNFTLLEEVGRSGVPVLLKRGFGCTIDEWLGAAEYVLREGNGSVILCERGVRSFERSTRFTLDLAAVAVIKQRSHLPVVVDPSHGTGHRGLVIPLALAAAAVGADGLIVDVHTNASAAKCDGDQALPADEFQWLMARLQPVLGAIDRPLAESLRVGVV